MKALNFPLLAPDEFASNAVTAVVPATVDAEKIRKTMNSQFDIALAGGQDHLKGKIFRIGHLGFVCDRDILSCVGALEATLIELGHQDVTPGAGVAAAADVFAKA